MDKTRVAVVGLGGISQLVHLPILNKLPNVEIAGVAEINKNRLRTVAEKFNIKNRFTDYNELLSKVDTDAVIIATPTNTHQLISQTCLKAKKDILIEKPISLNRNEANEINKTAKRHKCKVVVGMNLRFRPDAMLLKSLLSSGELGEVLYVKCRWLRNQSSSSKWFMKKNESGGGVLIDLGIVILDLALWLLDNKKVKSASVSKYHYQTKDVEDTAVGMIRLGNNATVSFDVSWSLHSDSDSFELSVFGTKGTAHLNPLRAFKRIEGTNIDYTPAPTTSIKNLFKKSYENEIKHFIGAVRGNNPVQSSSNDALLRMELLDGLYKSAEENKEIIF